MLSVPRSVRISHCNVYKNNLLNTTVIERHKIEINKKIIICKFEFNYKESYTKINNE